LCIAIEGLPAPKKPKAGTLPLATIRRIPPTQMPGAEGFTAKYGKIPLLRVTSAGGVVQCASAESVFCRNSRKSRRQKDLRKPNTSKGR